MNSRHFTSAVSSEKILRGMMFAYVLHKENTSNQIIYTSTLSSTAFKPLAEQCDSVQKTFLIFRYALQKIIFEAIETCKFHSKILWFFFFFLPGHDVWCPAHKNSKSAVLKVKIIASWQTTEGEFHSTVYWITFERLGTKL